MRRRKFITLLGSAAAVWPFVARAEQRDRTRLVGVLMGFAESDPIAQSMVAAFRDALPKLGWTEGEQRARWNFAGAATMSTESQHWRKSLLI